MWKNHNPIQEQINLELFVNVGFENYLAKQISIFISYYAFRTHSIIFWAWSH